MNSTDVGKELKRLQPALWIVPAVLVGMVLLFPGGGSSWFFPVVMFMWVFAYIQTKNLKRFRDIYEKFERMEQAKQAPSERAPTGA